MSSSAIPVLRSITGRLYCAIGIMFIGIIATNVQTIVYSNAVSESASALALKSIDGVRAVDAFDEILDDHRRALTAAAELQGPAGIPSVIDRLSAIEREFAENPALSGANGAPSAELAARLKTNVADLTKLSRDALEAATSARSETYLPYALEAYSLRTNGVEDDVAEWKTQTREAIANELAGMNAGADSTRKLSFAITIGGFVAALFATLIARTVLTRLQKLTSSMLALSDGGRSTNVPFRGAKDEIGLLADALEVFRDNALRVIASEANMSAVIENMVESIVMFSADDKVLLHNQKFAELLGLTNVGCVGLTSNDCFGILIRLRDWTQEMAQDLRERLLALRGRLGTETFDLNPSNGRSFVLTAATLPNKTFLICIEDITERRTSAAKIFHLAHHDSLTDLPNRALFQQRLGAAVDDAMVEQGLSVTLLLCDLDRFKAVNDTYGHPVGDELLRQVAQRMRETMRKTDVLARLGGDEFAIIHLSGTDPKEAQALAERIVARLKEPFEIEGNQVAIGVSIGIAVAPKHATCPTELMRKSDLALYAAKNGGRNMSVVYDATIAEKLEERRTLEIEMAKALDAAAFTLQYQPQVDLGTRRIIGFEALCRWNHPERGSIPPSIFIPVAEESGMIIELGEWILRRACADAVAWGGQTIIAVNVATQQFREPNFLNTVHSVLQDCGLPPQRLELEVTETAMLNDGEKMLEVLHSLRAMGVRLSVDDFGTGYSALHYLQKFPFNKIKIDQSFVRNLGNQDESDAIVRAVAGLGINLGLTTVAEGIETEEQAQIVMGADCGEGQGYLFGRPVGVSKVHELLATQDNPVLV